MDNDKHDYLIRTTLSPLTGMAFMFCTFLVFFVGISFVTTLLISKMSNQEGAVRIATLIQDIFVFILPALLTALIMTRIPARFLFIESTPRLWPVILSLITLFAAMPWLNAVIQWNESITFPESLKELENSLREAENTASEFVNKMLGGTSVGSLIVSVCIVGLLAALSEELFFRGALLRLFLQTRMNHHCAIWCVAVIFSLMHFQFFGFVPRMILGAYFGYLVWWTRCLWVPIIVHAVNNTVVVVGQWEEINRHSETVIEQPETVNWITIVVSLIITGCCLYIFSRKKFDNVTATY